MKRAAILAATALLITGEAAPAKKESATIASYAWPTTSSAEPKEEEWSHATALETLKPGISRFIWLNESSKVTCTHRVIREWMRITCTPPHDGKDDILFGVIWAMAGDITTVKGAFTSSSELPRYKAPPTNPIEDLNRKMGASATVTFQARPGTAFVVSLDQIGWDENYEGSSIFSRAGLFLDVSWALGEKSPTILYR